MDKKRLESKKKILEKLFALALHEDTPEEEAHAAMEKATMIMAKEKIAVAEILRTTDKKEDLMSSSRINFFYSQKNSRQDWELVLGMYIAEAFDCSYLYSTDWLTGKHSGEVIGYEVDVENVLYFFAYVQFKIAAKIRPFPTQSEKNSYGRGFSERIGQRLKEMNNGINKIVPSDCRDLMVIKKDLAEREMRRRHPNTRTKSVSQIKDYQAYRRGLKDGGNLALRKGVEGQANEQGRIQ